MANVAIFVCPGAQSVESVGLIGSTEAGTCESGVGRWQNVSLAEPFDPASLNAADLSSAFGAGFISLGGPLIFIWGARLVLRSVFG